jgi:hypothetical protein
MTLFKTGSVSLHPGRFWHAILNLTVVSVALTVFAGTANAQQTGDIAGQVTDASGAGLGGVTIEASSNVLPQSRTTTTADNGRYRIRLLPPGEYTIDFKYPDGSGESRQVLVLLQQTAEVDVAQGAAMEEIVVTGEQLAGAVTQGSLGNSISAETIEAIPTGQDYRDMIKLIPGVQYTEFGIRGPSAGGSGQDNIYQFDGVDVSLPLFGVLASEPASHDIAQVTIVRGGAKAVGFNRAGGFSMNTISKRGTDEFRAEVGYQLQSAGMTGDQERETASALIYDEDRSWITANVGGPLIRDRLYFYASMYRPERSRANSENAYGPVGDYESVRDEYFGKLTLSATDDLLFDLSYRTSDREEDNTSIGGTSAPSTSLGGEASQDMLIFEGLWNIGDDAALSVRYVDWEESGSSVPDTLVGVVPQDGGSLSVGSLDEMGYFVVPTYRNENDGVNDVEDAAFNAYVQSLIDTYSYDTCAYAQAGCGGGRVGGYPQLDEAVYTRESYEVAYDRTMYFGDTTHDLHFGYKYEEVAEDLVRSSNGWGTIDVPGGVTAVDIDTDGDGTNDATIFPYFQATVPQSLDLSASSIRSIYSSSELQSIEINDTITRGDWIYNVGVLISNDILYGQGLRPNPNNPVTGLEQAPGNPYKMYEVDWKDMIQPRLGITWEYSDTGSVYANFAKYHPPASSLARAASWDRNLRPIVDAYFDENGNWLYGEERGSSSGKWFQDGLKPRYVDEYLVGTVQEIADGLTFRGHVRHRRAGNFWEDTPNDMRLETAEPGAPPDWVPQELYVPNLGSSSEPGTIRSEIGGSSYVIAELDGAYTKFWEVSTEIEWSQDDWWLMGSYTWSHYYGNFDQDNTTTTNDNAIFIGSSNLADGRGRNVWDFKDGDLKGDRRHLLKLYGAYTAPWDGRFGAYLLYQSGEPWETWDGSYYGFTSSTIRYSEPAGSRKSSSHWQLDLNYTHEFRFADLHALQLRLDLYNVFDNQTGYNINPFLSSSTYGEPRSYYRPRRLQLQLKYQFN